MNKGILQFALSGTVELELEYREPRRKQHRTPQEHVAAQDFERFCALSEIADAFAWLLHAS